ncbi:hypothetical protein [Streptomyces sp. NPDC054834]
MSDEKVRDLLGTAVQGSPPTPVPVHCDVPGEPAWWRAKAQVSPFSESTRCPGSWSADEDAIRLSAFFGACRDDSHHADSLRDAVMEQFPRDVEGGLFVAVTRKADPFSALAYAPGPDAMLRLPGWFRDFLLDVEEVRAQLPAAEEGRALTGTPLRDAVERKEFANPRASPRDPPGTGGAPSATGRSDGSRKWPNLLADRGRWR